MTDANDADVEDNDVITEEPEEEVDETAGAINGRESAGRREHFRTLINTTLSGYIYSYRFSSLRSTEGKPHQTGHI